MQLRQSKCTTYDDDAFNLPTVAFTLSGDPFGTNYGVTNEQLERMILIEKVFDFHPYALIRDFGLMRPRGWSYRGTAAYGHFGRDIFPWEKTDRIEAVLKAV